MNRVKWSAVLVGAVVGVAIFSFFFRQVDAEAFWLVLGGAFIGICMGIAMMIGAKLLRGQESKRE